MTRATLVRALALYLPFLAAAALWRWRAPGPRVRAAVLLACAWNLAALLLVHWLAARAGWWRFEATGALLLGVPVDLYLGWALLWGAVPALAAPRLPLAVVVAAMLWLDLLVMPLCAPVVRLDGAWLVGEGAALALCLVPSQLLARWTAEDRRLAWRAALQALCFGGLVLGVLPAVVLDQTQGGGWDALLGRAPWATSGLLQLLALPVVLGLSAVQEFVARGGGTPIPYDPPRRLVTSGPYAYVANPMQLSATLVLVGWGAMLESAWVAAAGLMAVVYGAGLAAWDEGEDLARRFGPPWRAYRAQVRNWLPRWRPHHPSVTGGERGAPPARLYVAAGCGPCSEVGQWFAHRRPVGLEIVAAEEHPARDLSRITYDPRDGGAEEDGVAAVGRALEHVNLAWALVGMLARLPGVRQTIQLIVDASGGGPQLVPRSSARAAAGPLVRRVQ